MRMRSLDAWMVRVVICCEGRPDTTAHPGSTKELLAYVREKLGPGKLKDDEGGILLSAYELKEGQVLRWSPFGAAHCDTCRHACSCLQMPVMHANATEAHRRFVWLSAHSVWASGCCSSPLSSTQHVCLLEIEIVKTARLHVCCALLTCLLHDPG